MATRLSISKIERLKSKKAIASLFEDGNTFFCHPFRLYWRINDENIDSPAQVAVSVSKRKFKRAVDRNRIKRLMREAWRNNKLSLYSELEEHKYQIVVMLVYTSDEIPDYDTVEKKVKEIVSKLLLVLPDTPEKIRPEA